MSAPTLSDIMDGLDARLATIDGLRHSAYLADQVNPPQAVIRVPDIHDYRETFDRGTVLLPFTVIVVVSAALDRTGQQKLAGYASWTGDDSIPLALESTDITIDGVDQVVVDSFRNLNLEEVGVIGHYGGEFTGRVVARGA